MPEPEEPVPNRPLTPAEHRERHVMLHRSMDELLADYLMHHRGKLISNTTAWELIEWSHRQTIEPEELEC